jgi:hypothetical protein
MEDGNASIYLALTSKQKGKFVSMARETRQH